MLAEEMLLLGVCCPLLLRLPDELLPRPLGSGAMAVSNCRALAGGDHGHCTRGGGWSGRCCLDLGDVSDVVIGEGMRRWFAIWVALFSSTGGMVRKDRLRKVERERDRGGGLLTEW